MKLSVSEGVLSLVALSGMLLFCGAFVTPSTGRSTKAFSMGKSQLSAIPPPNSSDDNNNKIDPLLDLTSQLARIDQQWKIQQATQPKSRWTQITLNDNDNDNSQSEDSFYLLQPKSTSIPSCVITFLGGAGLGQFPQVAYNELLMRLSDRLNAAVLTVPYTVGLDHFELSKRTGDILRRGLLHCQDNPTFAFPETLPVYSLSHSLGCKLTTLYAAATQQPYNGIGLLAYNNFGFTDTVRMAKQFASKLSTETEMTISNELLDTIFQFAEQVVDTIGLEFSPSPAQMDQLLQTRYTEAYGTQTRLFCFDNDALDSTPALMRVCDSATVSKLVGTHLTPVYYQFNLQEEELPQEAREYIRAASGGFQSVSYGNAEELQVLVEDIVNWILGRPPSSVLGRPLAAATEDVSES